MSKHAQESKHRSGPPLEHTRDTGLAQEFRIDCSAFPLSMVQCESQLNPQQDCIAGCTDSPSPSSATGSKTSSVIDDGSSTVRAGLKMGAAPPCGRFMELATMKELTAIIESLDMCQSEGDIKLRVSYFNTLKSAIADLVTKAKAAASESHGLWAQPGKLAKSAGCFWKSPYVAEPSFVLVGRAYTKWLWFVFLVPAGCWQSREECFQEQPEACKCI